MHHFYRNNLYAIDIKRSRTDNLHLEHGHTRIRILSEAIIIMVSKILIRTLIYIHRKISIGTKRSEIVDSTYMIVMTVRDKHGIYMMNACIQRLLTKIGRRIYKNRQTHRADQCGCTRTLVLYIRRLTYTTFTSYFRNTF